MKLSNLCAKTKNLIHLDEIKIFPVPLLRYNVEISRNIQSQLIAI